MPPKDSGSPVRPSAAAAHSVSFSPEAEEFQNPQQSSRMSSPQNSTAAFASAGGMGSPLNSTAALANAASDSTLAIPSKLSLSDKLSDDKKLRVGYITWNMANKAPTETDIHNIFGKFLREVDVLIIAAQEETRDLNESLAGQIRATLQLEQENCARISFNTNTKFSLTSKKGEGCVSLTVLSKNKFSIENGFIVRETPVRSSGIKVPNVWPLSVLFGNKAGPGKTLILGDHKVKVVSAHLDSKSAAERLDQTRKIMNKLNPPVNTFAELEEQANTAVIFGGDLNYRNELEDGTPVDPRTAKNRPMAHFALHGLTEAGRSDRHTYSGDADEDAHSANNENIGTPRGNASKSGLLEAATSSDTLRASGVQPRMPSASPSSINALRPDTKLENKTKGGKLDTSFYRGKVTHNKDRDEIIVAPSNPNKSSDKKDIIDHKAVAVYFEVNKAENRFKRTKEFVIEQIEGIKEFISKADPAPKPEEIQNLETLKSYVGNLKDNDIEKKFLMAIYQQCQQLKTHLLDTEYERLYALENPFLSKVRRFFSFSTLPSAEQATTSFFNNGTISEAIAIQKQRKDQQQFLEAKQQRTAALVSSATTQGAAAAAASSADHDPLPPLPQHQQQDLLDAEQQRTPTRAPTPAAAQAVEHHRDDVTLHAIRNAGGNPVYAGSADPALRRVPTSTGALSDAADAAQDAVTQPARAATEANAAVDSDDGPRSADQTPKYGGGN